MDYGPTLVGRARSPRHRGRLPEPTGTAHAHNPLCGDDVRVDVETAEGRIEAVGFEGTGCAIAMGAADLVAGAVCGLRAAEVAELGESWLHDLLGMVPPPGRRRCASLGLEALQAALPDGQTA